MMKCAPATLHPRHTPSSLEATTGRLSVNLKGEPDRIERVEDATLIRKIINKILIPEEIEKINVAMISDDDEVNVD